MELKEIESAIEGVLFAAGEPVGVERLCLALDIDRITADSVCQRLADAYRYERRGIRLVRLDNSYQLCSAPEFADCIRRAFESQRPARLSQPALEVLAIIAYYQPATRAYVDQIRGVDSSYTVSLLLERDLIEECGRLAVPGRPIQYRTTQTFLRSFGLSNLDELPELPNTTPEDGQLTLEMQAAVERLQAAQAAEGTEEVTEEELLQAAREMAQADLVVIGAPDWDMTFPAALKIYLEWTCTLGITFHYTRDGVQEGLCRAKEVVYITTAGGPLEGKNFGFDYVGGLGKMFGIPAAHCLSAEGLDIRGNDPEAILRAAEDRAAALAEALSD